MVLTAILANKGSERSREIAVGKLLCLFSFGVVLSNEFRAPGVLAVVLPL